MTCERCEGAEAAHDVELDGSVGLVVRLCPQCHQETSN